LLDIVQVFAQQLAVDHQKSPCLSTKKADIINTVNIRRQYFSTSKSYLPNMYALKRLIMSLALLLLPLSATAGSNSIVLIATGDLLLGGSAEATVNKHGFDYPFLGVSDILHAADIATANLEAPLTRQTEPVGDKIYTFKVAPKAAAALQRAGLTLLTLANNHIGDFGPVGVTDTIDALRSYGLRYTGAGKDLKQARRPTAIATANGSVGFLAYSNTLPKNFYAKSDRPGTAPGYADFIRNDVRKLREFVDYIVVSFHWGTELMTEPKDYQQRLARLAIDNGANVVIGHHPHVLQGVEFYNGAVIYYSLGNFAFGSYSRNASIGGLARVTLADGGVKSAEILPLNVANHEVMFQPRPLDADTEFAVDFASLCAPLGVEITEKGEDGFWNLTGTVPQVADVARPTSEAALTLKRN
jgi:poly-gamma-glutamate synthesis protein (capsule biosynthesis protein)